MWCARNEPMVSRDSAQPARFITTQWYDGLLRSNVGPPLEADPRKTTNHRDHRDHGGNQSIPDRFFSVPSVPSVVKFPPGLAAQGRAYRVHGGPTEIPMRKAAMCFLASRRARPDNLRRTALDPGYPGRRHDPNVLLGLGHGRPPLAGAGGGAVTAVNLVKPATPVAVAFDPLWLNLTPQAAAMRPTRTVLSDKNGAVTLLYGSSATVANNNVNYYPPRTVVIGYQFGGSAAYQWLMSPYSFQAFDYGAYQYFLLDGDAKAIAAVMHGGWPMSTGGTATFQLVVSPMNTMLHPRPWFPIRTGPGY